jgi:hypothetical protein
MSCLDNEDLFISAVDVIRAALEKFSLSDEIIYRTLLPRILCLKGVWMTQIEKLDIDPENEEAVKICRVISQLLYETSRSFDGMFLVESENASTFEILAFILECAKFNRYSLDIYPSGIETATFPVYFIQSLGTTIRRVSEEREEAILYIREEEDGEIEENYKKIYGPSCRVGIPVVVPKVVPDVGPVWVHRAPDVHPGIPAGYPLFPKPGMVRGYPVPNVVYGIDIGYGVVVGTPFGHALMRM